MAATETTSESFDSDQQYLGTVYAKALLGATEKSGNTESVLGELDSVVSDVLAKLPKFEAAISSPRVPPDAKLSMLDKAFAGKMTGELLKFLKVVAEHDRFDCLRAMRRAARRLFNEARGRVEVSVRTAEPVSPDMFDNLANRLKTLLGQDVELTTEVKPDLIGGIQVRIGDTVFDGSLANRLEQVRSATLENVTQQIRDALDRFALAE